MSYKLDHDYFECACGTPEHVIRVTRADWGDGESLEYYFQVYLNGYYPWYSRIWIALKYVFGVRHRLGAFDETLMDQDKADKLALFLSPELQSLMRTKVELMRVLQNHAKVSAEKADSEVVDGTGLVEGSDDL